MSFVHLHAHTEYSLLDGQGKIKKMVARAKELGMPGLAITDHGTMFGVIEFFKSCKASDIKPIIGVEAYMAPRGMGDRDSVRDRKAFHLLLLAENETGYRNLLAIATAGQLEGYYYNPRIDHDFLAAHAEGLICTTGCLAAEVPRALVEGREAEARRLLDYYFQVFGPDRFFFELQDHEIGELRQLNRALYDLAPRYQAQFIATNDVHYVRQEDHRLQDILLCIQTGALVADTNRMKMSDASYHLRSPDEMRRLFGDVPGALDNTLLIAERCNVDLGFKGYRLPVFPVPAGHTPESYLRELCERGLARRYGRRADDDPALRERLNYEIDVINTMGFPAYFLIVWDLCAFARRNGIWYNARGSAAGSLVAYCLDITLVEPLEHDLIFERFLNPSRVSMPDIDLDFQDDRRHELLNYTSRKYGEDKVAQIITFGTLGARAAIRDVGRVLNVDLNQKVDPVSKLVPNIPGKPVTIGEALETVPEFKEKYESDDEIRAMIDIAQALEGTVRNAGTHAAGVVITDRPITDYVPLHRPTKTGNGDEESPIKAVTQFEMEILDSLGLLKVDFLGLRTLTIMARACEFIKQRHGVEYTIDNIPTDDPAIYQLLGRGDVAGVFQVEGAGMRRFLVDMKPTKLDHIIAMVALYRPGPIDFIPSYIRRMHNEEPITYRHPMLEPILANTYGITVYQEQIMRAVMNLAGYTAAEADGFRKVVAKKKGEEMIKQRQKFVAGAIKNGIPEAAASQIFDDWEQFARYGFNKCLPAEAEVIDADTGRLLRIGDLAAGRATLDRTLSLDTESLLLRRGVVTNVIDNGLKPVYRLTTQLGRTIEATSNHPFYTFNGWQMLGRLKPGDLLAVPRRIPIEGRQVWPDHQVIVLGHLLAEGNLCHPHGVYYYTTDSDQLADYVKNLEQFENTAATVSQRRGLNIVYSRRRNRECEAGVVRWAEQLGIRGKDARAKEIPAAAFELNNRQLALLVARMWEGDGHLNQRGRSLFYATASRRLALQLQHVLLRLGIISRLRQVTFPYKDGRAGCQLFVTGEANLQAFSDQIGVHFISQARRTILQRILQLEAASFGTRDVVPLAVREIVREKKAAAGLTWIELRRKTGVAQREFYPTGAASKTGFTRSTVRRLADFFRSQELRRYADSDVYWDKIVSIEFVGRKQVYDLTVPEAHNFVANDFVVHNSHAADYAIICAQTAFLKAKYPVEYMTALLTAEKGDTDKVALYVADTKRMGIEVEPPDVNYSGLDFTIDDSGPAPAIRFGLGAIKNVGEGPVRAILRARETGGRFKSIDDFCQRVDLRQVGKRALECLIKVGALDSLGKRAPLLAGLDTIMAASTSAHKAEEVGQFDLFGAMEDGGAIAAVSLPRNVPDFGLKELRTWEKELMGVYVSEHPLMARLDELQPLITHYSAELDETMNGKAVTMVAQITHVRKHISAKSQKEMGFATAEDLQGSLDLVLWPSVWKDVKEWLAADQIVVITGKVDAQGGKVKILVDALSKEARVVTPAGRGQERGVRSQRAGDRSQRPEVGSQKTAASQHPPTTNNQRPATHTTPPKISEPAIDYRASARTHVNDDVDPFAGEVFSPNDSLDDANGYEVDREGSPGDTGSGRGGGGGLNPAPAATGYPVGAEAPAPQPVPVAAGTQGPEGGNGRAAAVVAQSPDPALAGMIWEDRPALKTNGQSQQNWAAFTEAPKKAGGQLADLPEEAPKRVVITLPAMGDKLLVRRVYDALISHPGRDLFTLLVTELNGQQYAVDFYNESTTHLCDELIQRLLRFVPREAIEIQAL